MSSGTLTTEPIEVDNEEIVDGETVITTSSVDISYNVPIDRKEHIIEINSDKYQANGCYTLKVQATDLAGNITDETMVHLSFTLIQMHLQLLKIGILIHPLF